MLILFSRIPIYAIAFQMKPLSLSSFVLITAYFLSTTGLFANTAPSRTLEFEVLGDKSLARLAMPSTKESIYHSFERLENLLGRDFFKRAFSSSNFKNASELAQLEDFDNQSLPLISSEMRVLFTEGFLEKEKPFANALAQLSRQLRKLSSSKRAREIERWRGIFLEKMEEYLRYLASIKPLWRAHLSETVVYDSNINRIPHDDSPSENTGKDDFQSLTSLALMYSPWRNNTQRLKKRNLQLLSALSYMGHKEYTENDMLSALVAPRYEHHLGGIIQKINVQYQAMYLGLSKGAETRAIEDYFHQHTVIFGAGLEDSEPLFEWIQKSKMSFSLSFAKKFHFDQGRKMNNNLRKLASISQALEYGKKHPKHILIRIAAGDTDTEDNVNFNYTGHGVSVAHSHRLVRKLWGRTLHLHERLSYDMKIYREYLGGNQSERSTSFGLGARIGWTSAFQSYLRWSYSLKENSIDVDLLDSIGFKAKQHRLSFGCSFNL
ncbi:MAG: hypothetical protein HQL32_13535 [Planctomycetes bacterium]|nr:hypothetical protein [Planctomycetota bacterium]